MIGHIEAGAKSLVLDLSGVRFVDSSALGALISVLKRMDPLGFALENFDAVGRWREIDGSGKLIDASTQLVDGTK